MDRYDVEKELKEKGGDLNNGIFRNPKRLVEESNAAYERLSEMQREFCHSFMSSQSGKAAAIIAGYSPSSAKSKASQLLALPAIQDYIAFLGLMRAQVVALDSKEIISMQLKFYYTAMDKGEYREANKALDQLAKMTGMYSGVDPRKIPNPKELNEKTEEDKEEAMNNMVDLLKVVNERETPEED